MKKIVLTFLLIMSSAVIAFGGNVYSGKIKKSSNVQNSISGKINIPGLKGILNKTNNFLLKAGINNQNKLGKTPAVSKQVIPLSKLKKGFKLPGFQSLKNGITKIERDNGFDVPRFIKHNPKTGLKKQSTVLSNKELIKIGMNFLIEEKSLLKINDPGSEFSLMNIDKDKIGMTHIRYNQFYKGIEVWGKDLYVHLNKDGEVVSLNGRFVPTPSSISVLAPEITGNNAVQSAKKNLELKTSIYDLPEKMKDLLKYTGPSARKIIWFDHMQVPHLVWLVEIRSSINKDWYYFIDAKTGSILNSYNNVPSEGPAVSSGVDLNGVTRSFGTYQTDSIYYMIDASLPMYNPQSQIPQNPIGAIVGLDLRNLDLSSQNTFYFVASADDQWPDPASVSANYNALQTYKYYLKFFNRNSIDDSGMTIYSVIHVTEDGAGMENAFWNGLFMCYGDGQQLLKPLAGGLDVAAHEMTHGVTQHTANLVYQDQSGALNESVSDVFGCLVDSSNWTIGEDVVKDLNTFPSGAMRDMADPHNGGQEGDMDWQPAKMSEFVNTDQDNGGVHTNSGIPNHAFYLTATSIGRDKAAAIWYRALTRYLTRSAQFVDARIATVQAAADLFGDSSPEVNAVKSSWDNVEVFEGNGTPPPPSTQLEGKDWILAVNTDQTDPNSIYMANPAIQSNSDLHPLSLTSVSNRPAVTDTSGIILFIDTDHNLRALYADTLNSMETIIDTSRVWGSVAIGPGLASIALTSIYADSSIYYLDLINNSVTQFKIKSQSFDGPDANTALYADEMSFDPTGRYLLFDAYNEIKNSTGSKISYWNIDLLDIFTGDILNVFPSLLPGESVANPSFSKTSYNRFTFDYLNDSTESDYVLTMDFNSGNTGVVAGPLQTIGYPSYSKDDRTIAYHSLEFYQTGLTDAIDKMPLNDDMLNGTGNSENYLYGATYPVWFVIGSRITGVDDKTNDSPYSFKLNQNYPNPFNPTTTISYRLSAGGFVTIKVFDILGRQIATLVNGYENAGRHEVNFNAANLTSGMYVYQLRTKSFVSSKKMILLK